MLLISEFDLIEKIKITDEKREVHVLMEMLHCRIIISILVVFNIGLINSCSNGIPNPPHVDGTQPLSLKLPKKDQNNIWYSPFQESNDTVIIFVHGILGDSRGTWLYEHETDPLQNEYWPRLISKDKEFKDASIFLGGYSTEVDSLNYGGIQAARELFSALKHNKGVLPKPEENKVSKTVMEHKNLLFVTHSTGGIIVRYMLNNNRESFRNKTVGLALIASPSYGSNWANRLSPLLEFYGNKLGKQLEWNSEFLNQLHDNFKDLVGKGENSLPYLVGQEAMENHFVIHYWFWPSKSLVVEPESAAQYFSSPKMLPGTDHFSTVKPNNKAHPGYDFLLTFWDEKFRPLIRKRASLGLDKLVDDVERLHLKMESIKDAPHHREIILNEAEPLADQIIAIDDKELVIGDQIDKYRYAALGFLMSGNFERDKSKKYDIGNKAKQSSEKALSLIKDMKKLTPDRKGYHEAVVKWLSDNRIKDVVLQRKAIALAMMAQKTGSDVTIEMVKETFHEISSGFQELYPVKSNPDLKWAFDQ